MKRFRLSYYFKKYRYLYLLALISLVIYEGLDMVAPQVTQRIIDDVIGEGRTDMIFALMGMLLAVGVGRIVFGYIKEFTFDKTSFRIASDVRKRLFRHIQGLSVNYFDKTNTGEIMARLKDDTDQVQCAFGFIGMLIIQVVVHTGLILYFMFRISWKLALFPVVCMPACALFAIIMERKLDRVYEEISEQNAEMNTVAEENLAGVRVVKAFAREKHEIGKFLKHNRKYYELNMKQSKIWIKYNPLFQLIGRSLTIVSLLFGGLMVINGELTLGEMGAFVEYTTNAIWPMEMLGWLSNELARAFASKKKLDKVFAEEPVIKDSVCTDNVKNSSLPKKISGHVTFDHVSLSIDEKQILKDVSFDLPAGKTLGVMGATGSGKTSLVNMLLRFYDATEGSVKLDGHDVRELPVSMVRKSTAAVMQDVFLFSDTINENIRLGGKTDMDRRQLMLLAKRSTKLTREERRKLNTYNPDEDNEKLLNRYEDTIGEEEAENIRKSLEAACAADFIDKMDDRTETVIGERGVGLSGGQKQRISMARAFAKKAPILVLDDSTSALDMETEKEVQKNLEAVGNMTKIIIAHRISSVRKADEIIVLDEGKIIERGTHEQLLEQKGYYYRTWQLQVS